MRQSPAFKAWAPNLTFMVTCNYRRRTQDVTWIQVIEGSAGAPSALMTTLKIDYNNNNKLSLLASR